MILTFHLTISENRYTAKAPKCIAIPDVLILDGK